MNNKKELLISSKYRATAHNGLSYTHVVYSGCPPTRKIISLNSSIKTIMHMTFTCLEKISMICVGKCMKNYTLHVLFAEKKVFAGNLNKL